MFYINFRYRNLATETIDEAEDRKEAKFLLSEYTYGGFDPNSNYWISTRPTKDWGTS